MSQVARKMVGLPDPEREPRSDKNVPIMPQVTTRNKRMTNIKLPNGEYIQGIRSDTSADKDQAFASSINRPAGTRLAEEATMAPYQPLRYTPGLKCDAHLESLRPSRDAKHKAFSGDDIKKPGGGRSQSLNDTTNWSPVQVSHHNPNPSFGQQSCYPPVPTMMSPYEMMYPQDELTRIKMRNRRFQGSCGQEMMYGPAPMMMPQTMYPYMAMPPPMMMMPQQQPQMFMNQGTMMPIPQPQQQTLPLNLNTTSSFTKSPSPFNDLQELGNELIAISQNRLGSVGKDAPKPVDLDLNPTFKPRTAREICPTSVEDLPLPKKVIPRPKDPPPTITKAKPVEANVADQIAIRSILLGKGQAKSKPSSGKASNLDTENSSASTRCSKVASPTSVSSSELRSEE